MTLVSNDQPETQRSHSISAAANLIGVTTHTLRKWESRHGIVTPERTETGRRYYSAQQVDALRTIKLLLDLGHSLTHLADLSPTALKALLATHEPQQEDDPVASVDLVGPNVSLQKHAWNGIVVQAHPSCDVGVLTNWPKENRSEALIFETNTLPQETVEALVALRRDHYSHVVVIARMSSRRTRRHLRTEGVTTVDKMLPVPTLRALLAHPLPRPVVTSPTRQRFTVEQLAAVAAIAPSIDCECPNHIAELLINITAFEQYCQECKDTDPAEAKLHAQLASITGQARGLFETALIAVAEADNLDLENLPKLDPE